MAVIWSPCRPSVVMMMPFPRFMLLLLSTLFPVIQGEDFYGETMRMLLAGFQRSEKKFASFPELVATINKVRQADRRTDKTDKVDRQAGRDRHQSSSSTAPTCDSFSGKSRPLLLPCPEDCKARTGPHRRTVCFLPAGYSPSTQARPPPPPLGPQSNALLRSMSVPPPPHSTNQPTAPSKR